MRKRKLWVSIIAGLLALLMVLGIVASAIPTYVSAESSAEIKKRIEALKEDKKAVKEHMSEIDADIDDNYSEIEKIVAQKNLVDQEVFLLTQEVTIINNQIIEYNLLVADKQEELEKAEEHLEQLQAENKERIRAMEKNGKLSYWSVIFQANSFTDMLDRLQMIEQIQDADKARIDEMCVAAEQVVAAKEELEAEVAALEENKEELNVTQAELEVKREESDALLNDLVGRGLEFEALMEAAEDEMAELEADIKKAQKEYETAKAKEWAAAHPSGGAGSSSSAPNSGGWRKPCRYTAVTSPYGWRIHPIYGKEKFHYGVDLANSKGTPIYAAKGGTVSGTGYNSSAGYYVVIDHGDGFKSYYYHLTHYIVSRGNKVSGGQTIGYMGSTGASTGPHLHFGITYNGSWVNPSKYIGV